MLNEALWQTRIFPKGQFGIALDNLPPDLRAKMIEWAYVNPEKTKGILVDIEWNEPDRIFVTFHTRKKRYARYLNVLPQFVGGEEGYAWIVESLRSWVLTT